jgi:predicted HTH domain antitoxin
MEVTLTIPDNIAPNLALNSSDLSQSILEMAALEAYREGRITTFQLRELLGLSRMEIDGFLKERGVYLDYTIEELKQDSAAFEELLKRHNR